MLTEQHNAIPYQKMTACTQVWDIYGAVAGTAGQGLPLYRSRVQASCEKRMASTAPSARLIAERRADIQAVSALS